MSHNLDEDLEDNEPLGASELLTEVLLALVEHPEAVRVEEIRGELTTALTIHCAPTDRGIVIGRKGSNIEALRVIFNHMAAKYRRRVTIEVANSKQASSSRDLRRAS